MKYPQVVSMPSTVSDWLEEQLEVRGIDAVVYTRYILSLLHTHTIDVIYPDDDLPFSRLNKEVRSGRGRKRSRGSSSFSCMSSSSSDWWRHAHVDAERIKRSAAVECLMSVSDQNGEIEALVDELCEKLKQVKSSSSSPLILPSSTDTSVEKISPQELAAKYYAAFPPLKSQSSGQQPSNWIAVESKWKQQSTPNKSRKGTKKTLNNKQTGYGANLFSKVDGDSAMKARQPKQRFSMLSRNKNICSTPRKSESFTNWSLNMFSSNKKQEALDSKNSIPNVNMYDQCIADVWATDENEMNLYEDLPVDIQELLDSPHPKSNTVEMMNLANMKNEGKSCFIPYGANIINSIWSNEQDIISDNDINAAIDSESSLDFKFSSITIDAKQLKTSNNWPNFGKCSDNETNAVFESTTRRSLWPLDGFRSLPGDWKKTAEAAEKEQLDEMMNFLTKSLMKLNHCRESSCFTEILPRSHSSNQVQPFNPFGKSTSMFAFNSRSGLHIDREKEDLLTSERSHFKPISDKLDNRTQKQYADGATFVISNNLEKVDYKRSESGTMWLETGFGQGKKYLEYKSEDSLDTSSTPSEMEFILKFSICQNDKACQTEELEEQINEENSENKNMPVDIIDHLQIDNNTSSTGQKIEQIRCVCSTVPSEEYSFCAIHCPERPDSVVGELLWKYEMKACEKCKSNNNNKFNNITKWHNVNNWSAISRSEWDSDNLRNNLKNIWNGGEVCQSCLKCDAADTKAAPGTPQSIQNMQLREDISQDGEQLLTDLTNLQKSYMEELPLVTEMSCDISELLNNATQKERKRRHSFIVDDSGCWSFASRLEEDCLIQMSTLPTIRSITL